MTEKTNPSNVDPRTNGKRYDLSWAAIFAKVTFSKLIGGIWRALQQISRPNQVEERVIGVMVQGLLTKAPTRMATRFRRKSQAERIAKIKCKPRRGEKAMKTPMAKASAVRCGVSFNPNTRRI